MSSNNTFAQKTKDLIIQDAKDFIMKSVKECHERLTVIAALGSRDDVQEIIEYFAYCNGFEPLYDSYLAAFKAGNTDVMERLDEFARIPESIKGTARTIQRMEAEEKARITEEIKKEAKEKARITEEIKKEAKKAGITEEIKKEAKEKAGITEEEAKAVKQ